MPVVAMPNGDQVSFPDDMPADQIRSLIETKFPEAAQSRSTGFSQRFDAADRAPLRINLRQSQPAGQSPTASMLTDFLNQGSAASQGTTPNIGAHQPQLISSDLHQSDSGEILYRDAAGQMAPTDEKTQVALRDPSDNRLKLFARTPSTNEGQLSSAGRMLMTGMGAGAPTRLPAGPGMQMQMRAPSAQALKDTAQGVTGYNSPDILGLQLHPQTVPVVATGIKDELFNTHGVPPQLAKFTNSILGMATKAPPTGATANSSSFDTLRQMLGKVASSASAADTDRRAATIAIRRLDEIFQNLPQQAVVAGDPAAAGAAFGEARGNWSGMKHAEDIDKRVVAAQLRAQGANSGMNVGNTIRQRIADILISPELKKGFSPEAIAKMEKVVGGTVAENAARMAGNVMGGGGGMGAVVAGGMTGKPSIPIIGFALKSLQNALSMRHVEQLSEMIRADTPLGRQMNNPLSKWATAIIARGQNPTPRAVADLSLASRNLANNLKDMGIVVNPAELLRAAQGPMRAGAEDEQQ